MSVAGRIYRNGRLVQGVLHIDTQTGRIEKLARSKRLADHMDFGDRAILPGAIDLHVHFREPGLTHKEDFTTGSTAAACGGVTAYCDMPNTAPPTTTWNALKDKLRAARDKSVVDYAAWCGATWYLHDLPKMLPHSAGLKVYLGATTGDLLLDDPARLHDAVQAAARAGKPVVLHAEAQRVLQNLRGTEASLEDHHRLRPAVAEVEAVYDVMKGIPGLKPAARIHMAHAASVEAVQAGSAAGFSIGVCPHHLLLDIGCCADQPAQGKVNPPLRPAAMRDALWKMFAAGGIPIVESDHAPHTRAEKAEPFAQAPAGIPGVETMVPLLLAAVAAGRVKLATAVDAVTAAPADLLGVEDRGRLAPGARADFAVYDLAKAEPVRAERLHSKCGWTPFEGHDAVFPTDVFLAGAAVVQAGEPVAKPGSASPVFPLPGDL